MAVLINSPEFYNTHWTSKLAAPMKSNATDIEINTRRFFANRARTNYRSLLE